MCVSTADTHTVETHIYRLRKKINDSFGDNNFILNNKQGYYIWKKETDNLYYNLRVKNKCLQSQPFKKFYFPLVLSLSFPSSFYSSDNW